MNDNQVISLLTFTLIGMIFILMVLVCIYFLIRIKTKKEQSLSKEIIKTKSQEQVEIKKESTYKQLLP